MACYYENLYMSQTSMEFHCIRNSDHTILSIPSKFRQRKNPRCSKCYEGDKFKENIEKLGGKFIFVPLTERK